MSDISSGRASKSPILATFDTWLSKSGSNEPEFQLGSTLSAKDFCPSERETPTYDLLDVLICKMVCFRAVAVLDNCRSDYYLAAAVNV